MAVETSRVDIGFQGGQVLSVRLAKGEYDKLRKALGRDGWHDIKTQDSDVSVDLAQVVYVRIDTEQQKVGF